ncbi:MAG: 3'(2'),5'-bisphosphate nucleotidase [Syntrophales bacterium]|jgi:3'(2'), 5'-bisphosphate nucleotidase|nr:3'(2'),5'-bisphosphate nucleotidase [Syntrophales bacterium]MCK9527038.1 3'(2'),5'-bisphosphate nucleotidase [Syntrophales bacterium]MDX9921837.1 3'(2'),5'-bisphosphate nucleotidase [Syntrophales bacterium]
MKYDREQQIAIAAVVAAVRLCEQARADIPAALEKSDKSPVTVADFGSQALICRVLSEAFPGDMIVAEEDAAALSRPDMARHLLSVTRYVGEQVSGTTPDRVIAWIDRGKGIVAPRYWTVDPIDGTKGFLRGDQYAVALALVEEGDVKVGVLGCPAMADEKGETGVLYVATRGEGAIMTSMTGGDSRPLRVAGPGDGEHMRFVESVESSHGDQERQTRIARSVGITTPPLRMDSQVKYGVLASGKALLYVRLPSPAAPHYREKIWDHAAGSIIVEEAGGRVSDMDGKPLNFVDAPTMEDNRGVIASNGVIHDRVLAALKKIGGRT